MLKSIKNLDERQLMIRGNIFKHGIFTMGGLLLLNITLAFMGIVWAPGYIAETLILIFTIVLCCVEFVLHDIYPLTKKRQAVLVALLALYSLAAGAHSIWELSAGRGAFMEEGMLSETAGLLIMAIVFMIYPIVFVAKHIAGKRQQSGE